MASDKLLNGTAIFASSYVKRFLETHYDTLMKTSPARRLMEAGAPTRYGVEASLYALLAYADQQWSPQSPLGRLVREVVMDAPAEISKRLVNGFREDVLSSIGAGKLDQARSVEQALLNLDDVTLTALLAWIARTSPDDRARLRSLIGTLTDEELQKFARLAPQDLDSLLKLSMPQQGCVGKPPSRLAQAIKSELDEANRRADEQIAERRMRRPV